ncbi:protein of unknown function [Flavobacteriaceae bacterium MAR_2010_188]|nr:protein of unknown function [Flavobacteriaceae bacterium MAR_2010_188]
MFSKEESRNLRELFWTSFGKSFPRRWILYNTKIKGFSFKFQFDNQSAMVVLDLEDDLENRIKYWERLQSMKTVIQESYLPTAIFEEQYFLENGKEISRIYVELDEKVSIHNKNSWRSVMEFFKETMPKFEEFFLDFEDFLKS